MIDTNDQAYEFFVQESLELLQILEQGLMTLTQEHEMPKLHGLMRAAHSIKGGAACVGLMGIQDIAHNLENAIRALYAKDTVFSLELEELLLQAFDCLRSPILEQIEKGQCQQEAVAKRSQLIFPKIEALLGHSLDEASELPEVPMETDMTIFLFKEEVPSGLRRWKQMLIHPQNYHLSEELKNQAEVFATLGKMLCLPGFTMISEVTIKAIQVNPKLSLKIGKLALVDFWAAQKAVLSGDRIQGGKPSETLLKLTQSQTQSSSKTNSPTVHKTSAQSSSQKSSQTSPKSLQNNHKSANQSTSNSTLTQDSPQSPEKSTQKTNPVQPKVTETSPEETSKPLSTAIVAANSGDNNQLTLGVRVDLNRLELINNLVGELATQDNSFLLQNQQFKSSLETLSKSWNQFHKFIGRLQEATEFNSSPNNHLNLEDWDQTGLLKTDVQKTLDEMEKVEQILYEMKLLSFQSQQIVKKRQQTLQQVQKNLTETRMISIESLFNRFPRMVRDLSIRKGKKVKLNLIGQKTLVDKAVLEKLYDPLVHLVRNAFDHGIEPPDIRQKKQKSIEGKIEIKAYNQGNYIYIEVQDDGRGINLERIRKKAVEKRLISKTDAQYLTKNQLYDLLFLPDFSTTNRVTDLSGRGVGLEAVSHQVKALKGNITILSEVNEGTKFILRLPWSLTITKLLVFQIDDHLFAIAMDTVGAIVSASPEEIESHKDGKIYNWLGQKVPLVQSILSNYQYRGTPTHPEQSHLSALEKNRTAQFSGKVMVLLLSEGLETIGLRIDQILMEQNLTIKPFGKVLKAPPYFYGCTILGDGRLVPVIDSPVLLEEWQQKQQAKTDKVMLIPSEIKSTSQTEKQMTILVIDDSLTTRQSLCATLQQEGYTVIPAQHGKDGLAKLQRYPQVKFVICDLEMPEMNGLEFLSHCRRQFSREKLPVLMLTSRKSDRYRQLAKQLGSNGYMTKPWVKQELIKILQDQLLTSD
ncbi:hybrid sensor histidine kinase/response regulator [Lyngbya sp. PCC 8106]|uniref:hybrid sensor histidine kinase/response regulator n=1 Tax=Lyngbya sp. (strain PCC 8106) TaxID=313612 RepID=UPI0000EAC992|nr:hybrid sensor histidine kinase/response regulator [Lyngbya sp. PCC 8106]EAW37942.1 CheA like protein [Lyngbya sp. PCC 8106]